MLLSIKMKKNGARMSNLLKFLLYLPSRKTTLYLK